MTVAQALDVVALIVLALIVVSLLITAAVDEIKDRKRHRRARLEADLDRKQEELRRTILRVAEGLAADRDEASRQMARAAFLSSGQLPGSRR